MVDSDTCGDTLCAVWSMCHDGRAVLFYRSPRLPICLMPGRLPGVYLSHAVRDVSSLCIDRGRRSVASGLGAKVLRTVGIIWMIALG